MRIRCYESKSINGIQRHVVCLAALSPELGPAMSLPEHFDGHCSEFQSFMNQCCLLFFIALLVSLLTGEALDCASPFLEASSLVLSSWDSFQNNMEESTGW
uniref:Uncharacterized protein n=1 Tax=Pelusios castaneus TaxID=367368 RepID=A0A8C8RQG1_9SAUR